MIIVDWTVHLINKRLRRWSAGKDNLPRHAMKVVLESS